MWFYMPTTFFQGIHFLDKFLATYAYYLCRTQSYRDFSVEGVVNCAVRSSIDFTLHQIWWWPQDVTWRPGWHSRCSESLRPGRSGVGDRLGARDFSLFHVLPDRPCGPLNILYNVGLFLGVNRPVRDVNWSVHVEPSLTISKAILLLPLCPHGVLHGDIGTYFGSRSEKSVHYLSQKLWVLGCPLVTLV